MLFRKIGDDTYDVDWASHDLDFFADIENIEIVFTQEGKKIANYTTKYERSIKNRNTTISIHWLTCIACGFNFESAYGKRGEGYIEVHHLKPLFNLNEEIKINPKEDLVCICANCHRMIHRNKYKILTLQELKDLIVKSKLQTTNI